MRIDFYDTTLRDGAQSEDIAFSVNDKIRVTEKLDDFGMDFIEGGWPGSNPRDLEYFEEVKQCRLTHARIVAFSSTIKAGALSAPEGDEIMQSLLRADTEHVAIVGKSWDLHVRDALRVSLDTNLRMIERTIRFLKGRGRTVFFDAEHFFDGYRGNREYAVKVVKVAADAGADVVVLCDTNGGSMPFEIGDLVGEIARTVAVKLGIHCHNDTENAVGNTLMAVRAGCVHVQGTTNGYGERCGNANLCSVIPDLVLKMGCEGIDGGKLRTLRDLSVFVDEVANLIPDKNRPYVGSAAFAHKGGIHASAVRKNPATYEHIDPTLVGNSQRFLVSDLSGESTILLKAKEFGINMDNDKKAAREVLRRVKEMEHGGYKFEGAEASLELLMKRALGMHKNYFELIGFRVVAEKQERSLAPSEATIMLKGPDGRIYHKAAFGNGPVNALDGALRKALHEFYPILRSVTLVDFKVRALSTKEGTGTIIRVLIESSDGVRTWETVGVSENIIEASWQALVDSIDYKLLLEEEKDETSPQHR